MKKFFNVNGSCNPQIHYMIDLSERLSEIKKMVDLLGRGDLLHHAGQIVAIGETVADPQHPQGILRRLGHAAQRQQNQQKAESEFHHIFKVLGWR